jgi:hypothetical protein
MDDPDQLEKRLAHAFQFESVFPFRTSRPQIGQACVDHILRPGKTDSAWIQNPWRLETAEDRPRLMLY